MHKQNETTLNTGNNAGYIKHITIIYTLTRPDHMSRIDRFTGSGMKPSSGARVIAGRKTNHLLAMQTAGKALNTFLTFQ